MPGRSARSSSCRLRVWRGWFCRGVSRWRSRGRRRQIERRHEIADFLARRDMAQGQRRAAAAALEIEQGQALQEELLVDHALAQARGGAKADALGQCLEDGAHVALV